MTNVCSLVSCSPTSFGGMVSVVYSYSVCMAVWCVECRMMDVVIGGDTNVDVTCHSNWSLDRSPAVVWAVNDEGVGDTSRALGVLCRGVGLVGWLAYVCRVVVLCVVMYPPFR